MKYQNTTHKSYETQINIVVKMDIAKIELVLLRVSFSANFVLTGEVSRRQEAGSVPKPLCH